MLGFLVKASLVLFILWAFYKLLLERESFFAVNRVYLLGSLFLAFSLPFVALPELVNNQGVVSSLIEETSTISASTEYFDKMPDEESTTVARSSGAEKEFSVQAIPISSKKGLLFWMSMFYGFGVLVLTLHLISQFVNIRRKINRGTHKIRDGSTTIIHSKNVSEPCSFFNFIFINPEKYDSETYEQILEHEKVHVKCLHSVDLLLAEIAIVVLWFNPFVWLFRKEIEKNIEYQTDNLLLNSTLVQPEDYQMNLLTIATSHKPLSITSNYNQSLIKKRIIMMNKKKSNGHSYWKYAFIAPTLLVTLLFLNQPFALQSQEPTETAFVDGDEENNYENEFDDDLVPFLRAVRSGDYSAVQRMIEKGSDVNLTQRGEGTSLTMAIRHEEHRIAKLLLEKGADPNLGTESDGYPLWMAARKGDIELVKMLLEAGAEVNTKFPGDGSALIQACKQGHLKMVQFLVENKADVNMAVRGDGNPLIMASRGGYLPIVAYLVSKGAEVNEEVKGDETPLISASEQGHLKTVEFLVENGADVNKECKEMVDGKMRICTALKMAKEKEHDEVVKYLLQKGAIK
ncbi:ankyrin repeat domain-containing protein [Maribacter halichondriae]|uniref:ankyrin repeat domain-containing protein n=1 Tax=Maribacter halichondriae TaxID=2980554 RepID=UPI002358745B|nr:ankyrin repeat domain-containing protein [Maribacter sp. Hal144]